MTPSTTATTLKALHNERQRLEREFAQHVKAGRASSAQSTRADVVAIEEAIVSLEAEVNRG